MVSKSPALPKIRCSTENINKPILGPQLLHARIVFLSEHQTTLWGRGKRQGNGYTAAIRTIKNASQEVALVISTSCAYKGHN